jgi:hypothetical protein
VVYVEGLGAGSRAFDLPQALLVAAGEGHATEPAAALRRMAEAVAAVPAMVWALKHAVALTGA